MNTQEKTRLTELTRKICISKCITSLKATIADAFSGFSSEQKEANEVVYTRTMGSENLDDICFGMTIIFDNRQKCQPNVNDAITNIIAMIKAEVGTIAELSPQEAKAFVREHQDVLNLKAPSVDSLSKAIKALGQSYLNIMNATE